MKPLAVADMNIWAHFYASAEPPRKIMGKNEAIGHRSY
jgi:hypothetical protein